MSTVRIAHLSDPHVLDMTGVSPLSLILNKRVTGWINLKLHRNTHHKPWVVEAMMDDLASNRVDHVVVTGDLTNLALEPEFVRARAVLERAGYGPEELTVIPGNHDLYTRGAERSQRFAKHFAKYITSDLDPGEDPRHPSGPFPFVRLRGPAAIIGLSTAVARLPVVASGWAGAGQLASLARLLDHPEVRKRTPVILSHHPITNPRGLVATALRGWGEADALRRALARQREALALHGHLHHRVHEVIRTEAGAIHRLGATSASLLHDDPDSMAGYNLYEVGDGGLERVSARVWSHAARRFEEASVPTA